MTRCILRVTLGLLAASGLAVAVGGCAAKAMYLPKGPGAPVADASGMLDEAAAGCRTVRTLQAELAISGRVGESRLRGRVIAGFERPGAMRLEAVAPFGPPAFLLASRSGSATLLIPRDARILVDAAPASVVEALTGIALTADDLLAILAGCVSNDTKTRSAQTYADGWASVEVSDGTTLYLRLKARRWVIVAGTRGRMSVEYGDRPEALPARVRLRTAGDAGAVAADLSIVLSQVETNAPIDPRAFSLQRPDGAVPLTLDELRRSGPLGQRR